MIKVNKATALLLILILAMVFLVLGCATTEPWQDDIYFSNVGAEDANFETLHLTGQTATDPPLQIDGGSLLTRPQSGTLEYDGESFYLTNINHRRFISRACDSLIKPQTVSNTTVETTVFTDVLNANELSEHRVYRLPFYGEFSTASASDTVTIKVKVNGTVILSLTSTAGVATNDPVHGWAVFTVRSIGTTGTISAHAHLMIAGKEVHANTSSLVINTAIINNLVLTFQWGAAKVGNTITLDQAFLEVLD